MSGRIGNSGFKLKPLAKAGTVYHIMRSKGKKYPTVSANKMNTLDHPLGGSYRKKRGGPMTTSHRDSPGVKYGSISAKRTGRKKK
jgi:large subunit ribosomal protein L2